MCTPKCLTMFSTNHHGTDSSKVMYIFSRLYKSVRCLSIIRQEVLKKIFIDLFKDTTSITEWPLYFTLQIFSLEILTYVQIFIDLPRNTAVLPSWIKKRCFATFISYLRKWCICVIATLKKIALFSLTLDLIIEPLNTELYTGFYFYASFHCDK